MGSHAKKILTTVYDNTIRDYLPRKVSTVNGVKTRKHRLLRFSEDPDYEQENVDSLKSYANSDDTVLILGGGFGVTAVWAARVASNVIVYEAAKERIDTIREAIKLNSVEDSVAVHHGIVAENKHVYGDSSNAAVIPPTELPDCDVLEMDIEGAELTVLRQLSIRPRVIIVETHAQLDSPADAVVDALSEMGYDIVESERQSDNISIITAVRE